MYGILLFHSFSFKTFTSVLGVGYYWSIVLNRRRTLRMGKRSGRAEGQEQKSNPGPSPILLAVLSDPP